MLPFISDVYITKLVYTTAVLVLAFFFSLILKKIVDIIISGVGGRVGNQYILAKTRTIRSLLKNIIDVVLVLIGVLIIMSSWGFNIIPILTGAGILGLAISFGAQTLIKDLINGFLIIAEDQFNVGDRVKIGSFDGEVYKITLRLTILRDKKENLIYIPNSQVTTVVKLKEV